jgi:hypothetical protein
MRQSCAVLTSLTARPKLWILLLAVVFCSLPTLGQQAAELVGQIIDPSGAIVAGANIEATNEATGVSRTMGTNALGVYRLAPLPAGVYTLRVSASGFKTTVKTGITLQVNQSARTDFTLDLGEVAQVTQVVGETPVVASENATLGLVVDNKKIIELPLNGRNYLDLARLTPGVSQFAGPPGTVNVNGGGSHSGSLMQLDGVDNYQTGFGFPNILPSIDMIQEFKIQTAQFGADQGRASIGQINVISKGGTNQLHGTAYEYNRNAALAALNFFDLSRAQRRAAGLSEVPPFIRNQFGFSLGGPIKRNKTFFFGNYEGNLIRQVARGVLTVPDAQLRTGDFSGRSLVYDPMTLDPATNQRMPFPGNQIPSSRIAPVSANYLGLTPLPNGPSQFGNYTASIGSSDNIHQMTGRLDHNFSSMDIVSARYTFQKEDTLTPGQYGSVLFPGFGAIGNIKNQNASLQETHIFSPNTVNEVLLGFNRIFQNDYHQHQGKDIATELGLAQQSGIPLSQRIGGFPLLSVQGFDMPSENPYSPFYYADYSYQFYEKLTRQFTKHSLKAGVEFTYKRSPLDFHVLDRGEYDFSPTYTTSAPLAEGGPEQAFGDFLLGFPNFVSRSIGYPTTTENQNWWSLFVQDDWRVTSNLTLNVGLRYELYSGVYERFNRFNTFCIDKKEFCRVGQDGVPRPGYPRDKDNFGPRFGFAWRIFGDNKTVLRGGYGIFYDYRITNTFYNMEQAPPWQFQDPRPNQPDRPVLSFQQPFPGPVPSTPTAADQTSGSAVAPYYKTGYAQQWSLGLQRELMRDTVIDAAYVANRGISAANSYNLSYVTPGFGSPIPRRQYPAIDDISFTDNSGHSWYDSMQVRLERRFVAGFNFVAAYTWAKSLALGCILGSQNECQGFRNPTNFGSDKGPGPADIRHRLVVSSVFELPFGKGKPLLGGASRALNLAVGGWEFSAIATFQTGQLVTPFLSFDNSNAGGNRPDLIGNPNNNAPHTLYQWFDTSAFVNPPTLASVLASGQSPWRSQGNSGTGVIIGPGFNDWDISLVKRFSLWERHSLGFRTEFFNAWNHPNFGSPYALFPVVPGLTGRIFGTSIPNRTIQMALRYEF